MDDPFYFRKFEHRRPPAPVPYSPARESLYQVLAIISLVLGGWYIWWRWTSSLNPDALWFAIPVVVAETCAYFGLILFTVNLWHISDPPRREPPYLLSECTEHVEDAERPIAVDVFFTTYSEDPELVRLSLQDAKRVSYPHPIDIRIHVLDDGRRPEMQRVAQEESVNYITRSNNVGFKAGNLRNGLDQTSGDFILICDADTRPFATILEHTLGYFRDPNVAWVQTPQWFFDIPEGKPLSSILARRLGSIGRGIGRILEGVLGPIRIGTDPFGNDPRMFYDCILRRRNWANASFCCGAGSIHRREAIMQVALRQFGASLDKTVARVAREVKDRDIRDDLAEAMTRQLAIDTELTPYKFHVSEDIYTSMVLHEDRGHKWRSIYHPEIESKMLSPQDLLAVTIQRFKYAGGTLDIAFHDNPLFRRGLSLPQRLLYGNTMWSYLATLWNVVFLLSPVVFLFTGIAPVSAYSFDFYKHCVPFLIANNMALMVGTWGLPTWHGQALFLSTFPVNMRAFFTVLRGKKISFPVTPKMRQEGVQLQLVRWQILLILLTALGIVWYGTLIVTGHASKISAWFANSLWGLNNSAALSGIVRAAFWKPDEQGISPGDEGAGMTGDQQAWPVSA